jgi:hypothetical protein
LESGKNTRKKWRPPELEDQDWFPEWLRNYQTTFLATLDRITGLYAPVNLLIAKFSPAPQGVVDLASGSGQSALRSTRALRKGGAIILLTDKFPPKTRSKGIPYRTDPLDLTQSALPPADLYTMFNAFHHFDREHQVKICLKATNGGASLLIVEPLRPKTSIFIKVFLSTLIGPLLIAPFMRPFSWRWLVLTYFIPLGVLATWWDGMASVMRSLSEREWKELEEILESHDRRIEQGLLPTTMNELKYFVVR